MTVRTMCWLVPIVFAVGCDDDYDDPNVDPTPGVARDDVFVLEEDEDSFWFNEVKENDDEQVGTIRDVSEPVNGAVVGSAGSFTYHPDPGWFGVETLTYEADDGAGRGGRTSATVTFEVRSDGIGFEHSQLVDEHIADAMGLGDLDGDGKKDIVTSNKNASSIAILINRSTVPQTYEFDVSLFEGGRYPRAVVMSDVDRDGRLDIVTASGQDDALVVLRNTAPVGGAPSFAAPLHIPSLNASDVVAFDLDGDGLDDLVALDEGNNDVIVHMSASTGPGDVTFRTAVAFDTPSSPTKLLITDLDGDTRQDLVVVTSYGQLSLFVNTTPSGSTVPTFAARVDRATAPSPQSAAVADLDGDGQDEIVVLHQSQPMWIYANRGSPGSLQYEAARIVEVGANARVAHPMDLDADGKVDLLIGNDSVGYTHLLNRSASAASFDFEPAGARVNILGRGVVSQGAPTAIRVADLDGAGAPEIIVSASKSFDGGVLILYGD